MQLSAQFRVVPRSSADPRLAIARRRYQAAKDRRGLRFCFIEEGGRLDSHGPEGWVRLITFSRSPDVGEKHIRYALSSYVEHHLTERPQQGLGNRRIIEPEEPQPTEGLVLCRERLGGLLKSYYREAA